MVIKQTNLKISKLLFCWISIALLVSCGSKKKSAPSGPSRGAIEQEFVSASQQARIPMRFLMAVGYLESRLDPKPSTALYLDADNTQIPISSPYNETAFGIAVKDLEIDPANKEKLAPQISAYAKWLSGKLNSLGIKLDPGVQTAQGKLQWLWEIAQIHRSAGIGRRNVPVLFVKELMQVLNDGFTWQSESGNEILTFAKENPPLKIDDFPLDGQKLLTLDISPSDIPRARFFSLSTVIVSDGSNNPKRIEVIHCPFTLSACLSLQENDPQSEFQLKAHYIIPNRFDLEGIDAPLQINRHDQALERIGENGKVFKTTDAISIMLVGESGKIINSIRQNANPMWYTDEQLKLLGKVVNDLCTLIAQKNQTDVARCLNMSDQELGIRFYTQKKDSPLYWGQIPDFEYKIFRSYIENPNGLLGETALTLQNKSGIFQAGDEVRFNVYFQLRVKAIEAERLMRCTDGKLVWSPFITEQIRSKTEHVLALRSWDSGPNGNGTHFIRVKVYGGEQNDLLGWDTKSFHLKKFEGSVQYASARDCLALND